MNQESGIRNHGRSNLGFSTMEMLLAMAILILALTAVLLVSFGSQSIITDSQTGNEALNKAQELLENEQALARKDFKLVNPIAPYTDDIYTKKVDVQTLSDNASKKVTATISWQGDHNRAETTSLSALVTNFNNAVGGDTCSSVLTGNWATPQVKNPTTDLAQIVGDASGLYPVSGVDVSGGKLYVAVNSSSLSVGPKDAGSGADDASVGSLAWTNPGNVLHSDNTYATRVMSGTNVTHYIKATNFGFNIPTGASILGIKVEIERLRNGGTTGDIHDSVVKIVKSDGTIGITNKADTVTNWPTSDTYASYGSSSDLWNQSDTINWTPAAINSSNFGAVLAAVGSTSSTNRTANVDHVRITVTYIKTFYVINVSNPAAPVLVSGLANNPAVGTGFNAVAVAGNYAYVATNSGPASDQLQVIDVSVTPPVVRASLVMPTAIGTGSQAIGQSITYNNGYVYLGLTKTQSGPEFNIIDVHNPLAPSWVGSYSVGSGVESIYIKGKYAYLGTDDNNRELMILNVGNPLSPALTGIYNASGSTGFGYGKSINMVGDSLYLGRTYVSNAPEFYILDASNPAANLVDPPSSQTADIGPNSSNPFSANSVIIRDTLAFILTGSGTKGGSLQIFNTSNLATAYSTVALPNGSAGIGGTAMDCEGNYMYAGSVDTSGKGYISIITAP